MYFFKIEVYIAVPSKKAPLRYHVIWLFSYNIKALIKVLMMTKIFQHALLADEKRLPANFLTVLNQFGEVV